MKKLISLVLAIMMVAVVGLAFASDPAEDTTSSTPATNPGDLTVDAKVTVSGLEEGDSVKAYQFITWDTANNNWKVADGVGLSMDDIKDGLNASELATLASHVDKMTEITDGTITDKVWERTCGTVATAGSYLILIASGTSEYVYNPAVVSADFDGTNSAAIALTTNAANIKKQPVTLEKKADNKPDDYDVQVGDIVPFTVTVTVPQYNANWTEPKFEVTDTLSNGLTLEDLPTIEGLIAGTDYTLTGEKGDKTFTITFAENYLKTKPSTVINIKYSALVGEAVKDTAQVHEESNTVKLTFSNDPSNTSSHKEITDDTHHYTFAIDGSRFGSTPGKTTELIKVGIDANGQPVTIFKETEMPETVKPLAGAEFTLTGTGPNGEGTYSMTATSDADGRLFFNNLEVGTYTLKETSAPAGYMKDQSEHTVVISAEYNEDTTLKSYSIKIDNNNIATYTATTKADKTLDTITPGENNSSFPINDPKGTELPSTGGIGTTIFYIVGGLLLVGAAIVLVARRKAHE
jgi:fimbrial isopeptide formation D2 family protein/LPXTG-motif cell wall-anchored protein